MSSKIFTIILLFGIISSVMLGIVRGAFDGKTLKDDLGMMALHDTASNLVNRLSFHDEATVFEGYFYRPPGYSLALAGLYIFFGEYKMTVWTFHLILWLVALTFLWRISTRFLEEHLALIPPLLFSLWWGAAAWVFSVNAEIFSLVLILLFVFFWLRYDEERTSCWIIGQGVLFGWLILTKPIFLYAIPFLGILFVVYHWPLSRKMVYEGMIALVIVCILVASWALYSYQLLGSWQLASGALTFMHRADDVHLSFDRIKAFATASLLGNYIADILFPGYAEDPETFTKEVIAREIYYRTLWYPDKSNEGVLQKKIYQEAASLIRESPFKFVATGLIYLVKLNQPVNYQGTTLDNLFVGTNQKKLDFQKLLIILGVRLLWFGFVALVLISYLMHLQMFSKQWWLILFLVAYVNGMYALVSHAEARYLLPVMPFYFLLFAALIKTILLRTALYSTT